jgi:hypothetical protein
MNRKALSSRKARWAPKRWAFVYRWPLIALPMRHGLFVALDGPALRHLATPVQRVQDLPYMRGLIAHAQLYPNHGGYALQGPQLVGKAIGLGAFQQPLQ